MIRIGDTVHYVVRGDPYAMGCRPMVVVRVNNPTDIDGVVHFTKDDGVNLLPDGTPPTESRPLRAWQGVVRPNEWRLAGSWHTREDCPL